MTKLTIAGPPTAQNPKCLVNVLTHAVITKLCSIDTVIASCKQAEKPEGEEALNALFQSIYKVQHFTDGSMHVH
jgi:hypothetical protein